jgi:hypothetical protein
MLYGHVFKTLSEIIAHREVRKRLMPPVEPIRVAKYTFIIAPLQSQRGTSQNCSTLSVFSMVKASCKANRGASTISNSIRQELAHEADRNFDRKQNEHP